MQSNGNRVALAILVGLAMAGEATGQTPLGTAFTYQGRLTDGGSPATGNYDLQFTLFDSAGGAGTVGSPVTLINVPVSAGLFTVDLDFGAGAFAGDARWLAVGARPGGSGGPFTPLSPRQQLTPSPGALFSTTAASFSGSLAGEVTGTQAATVVSNAVSTNTASAIVRRDATGNFAAGTITADLSGNATSATTATTATTATSFTGPLAGEVTGTQAATVVSNAVPANTPNAVVRRDGSGNFAAGTISADLSGNATSATNFSGALAGEVTGNQGTTVVSNAVSTNTANAVVRRDASGNFAAGTITANLSGNATSATNFSGALAGEVTGNQGTTVVSNAVSTNTASAVVRRDGTGSFSAGGLTLAANLDLPNTASSTTGVLSRAGGPYLHNFGSSNTFLGSLAGNFTLTGIANVGVGDSALAAAATGSRNTAVGFSALSNNAGGAFNVAIGAAALTSNVSGSSNIAIGRNALISFDGGTGNIAVGAGAGGFLDTGSNNIYLGNGGASESDAIRIGVAQTATFIAGISGATVAGGVAVLVDGAGHLGTLPSSSRYKEQIADMAGESDVLMQLRPVSFLYRPELDETRTRQYGLVAEEVAKVAPELVVYDAQGTPQTVRYHFVNAMLLSEVQKQRRLVEEQRGTIERQEAEIQGLTERLGRLEAAMAGIR